MKLKIPFLFFCMLLILNTSYAQPARITISFQFLLPLAYQSVPQDNTGPEFHAPRSVLSPGFGGEIGYTRGRHFLSLIVKQGVIGTSFSIMPAKVFTFDGPYYARHIHSQGLNQVFLSVNYGTLFNGKARFLFNTTLKPFWQIGVGYGFNNTAKYYAEELYPIQYLRGGDANFIQYDLETNSEGWGAFITPRLGFKILSRKKQKEIFNFNFFYDYGLRGQANFPIKYSVGTFNANGTVNQVKGGSTVMVSKGQSFGLSVSTPLYSFKTRK
jgi:hypothetical protein